MFGKRVSLALLTAAVSVLLAGARCSNLGAIFQKPELQFRGLHVNSFGFEGASLDILVDVYNPNSYRLALQRFSYDLAIENVRWGLGSSDSPMAVEAQNSATIRLPLEVSWSRLGDVGRQALQTGSVNYGVTGEVIVGTSLGDVRVPYSKSGRFSILDSR